VRRWYRAYAPRKKPAGPISYVREGDLAQAAAQRAEIGASSLTVCSEVMRGTMGANDHLLAVPPRGCGPQLLIRYALPRTIPKPRSGAAKNAF
jgi:hypothetical protein